MKTKSLSLFCSLIMALIITPSCANNESDPFNQSLSSAGDLYIATGACYGGGVATTAGPSNMIAKFDSESGRYKSTLIDYNQYSPGDSPIAMTEYDDDHILVLVENTSGRRIDLVSKRGDGASIYLLNSIALSAIMRTLVLLSDYSVLVSKSSAIEKFNSAKSRVTMGANPYVSAPAGACATSTTLISSIGVYSNGKFLYSHAAATPNNKIALIASTGYAAAGDCLVAQAGPTTTALPTKILLHSSGNTLVTYGSTTAASNLIYTYTVNTTANTITAPTASWIDNSIVNGPSAITEVSGGDILVSNATSTFNTIERFSYNTTSKIMSRVGNQPFIPASIYTRCVTDMKVYQ